MVKRIIALLAALFLLFSGICTAIAYAQETPAVAQSIPDTLDYQTKAKGAVLIDAQTGRVLFAQNANARLPMASTTKIMSALLTLEQDGLDEWFTVDSDAIRVEGSSMGLREGDLVTLRALAYGMLLPSGNDAANVAAVRIAGSKQRFAERMNQRAQELGLEDTSFVTPSGLDDPNHYSSAYDMALLDREALENPLFADICSKSSAAVEFGNPPYRRWLKNHNRLLTLYEGASGVKTGFTDDAGRCLVSCATRNGITLIAVTLNCPDDWNEHSKLYDRYFDQLSLTDPSESLPVVRIPVTGGTQPELEVAYTLTEPVALLPGETLSIKVTSPAFLYAPINEGQVVGYATLYCDHQPMGEIPMIAPHTIESASKGKRSLLDRIFRRGTT